jgi:hypothetical protein
MFSALCPARCPWFPLAFSRLLFQIFSFLGISTVMFPICSGFRSFILSSACTCNRFCPEMCTEVCSEWYFSFPCLVSTLVPKLCDGYRHWYVSIPSSSNFWNLFSFFPWLITGPVWGSLLLATSHHLLTVFCARCWISSPVMSHY